MSAGRPTSWMYKLQNNSKGSSLRVPRELADQIPTGSVFQLVVTEEGLLYQFMAQPEIPKASTIPWIEKESK